MSDLADLMPPPSVPPQSVSIAGLIHAARWPVNVDAIIERLEHDELFRIEMALCSSWHIPHSTLCAWSDHDREKAIAFFLYESQRCKDCGLRPTDWPDDFDNENPPFEPDVRICHGCEELARWNRHLRKTSDTDSSILDGVKPYLRKRT